MKRLLYLTTLGLLGALVLAPAAFAQESGDDCAVPAEIFGAPEAVFAFAPAINGCFIAEGQVDPLIAQLNGPVYDATTGEELGLLKDVDTNLAANVSYADFCAAFPTRAGETAQEYFDGRANAQEQAILDPDANGIACDAAGPGAEPEAMEEPLAEEPPVAPEEGMEPETMTEPLPDTGGPALLMPVAILMLGAGLLGAGVLRRR